MSEEWGPWVDWDCEKSVAEPVGTYVQAYQIKPLKPFIECFVKVSTVEAWSTVKRYRVRKPKGLTILQDILREVELGPELV